MSEKINRGSNINWYPGHMLKAKNELAKQLKSVDVVLEMRDARIPISSVNHDLEELLFNKKRILLFNKTGLADKKITKRWNNIFEQSDIPFLFIDALNKIDLVKSELLLPIIKRFQEQNIFSDTFMVSAENGSGCEKLLEYLSVRIPDSPWLYPEDEVSDLPQRLLAAEITREQVLLKLHQELPYGATVETEEWTERDDGAIVIHQLIYVKRPGHKKIALGRNGNMIKAIGKASRQELQVLLDRTVHLFLFVKVRENWIEDPDRYSLWGLDPNA